MIVASLTYWGLDPNTGNHNGQQGPLVLDSQPDGTFRAVWMNKELASFAAEGRTLVGTAFGSRLVAQEIADPDVAPGQRDRVPVAQAALGLATAAMEIADWMSVTKSGLVVTLDGSTITVARDGDEVGVFNAVAYFDHLGWKGKLLGRVFSPYAQTRVLKLLDDVEARLKKAGQPDWFLRDAATGACYKSYGVADAVVKEQDKAVKAIQKERDAIVDKNRFDTDMTYRWAFVEETQRRVHEACYQRTHDLVLNMTDPKKGPVGAKKFKRFSDAKMHMLYLVGHFVPSRAARAEGWPQDYDDVPKFLMNDQPVKIPASWEIIEIATKGAEPKVVMTAGEVQEWLARHARLKVLTDRYGSVVKAVYGKLEKDGKIENFPYVLVLGADDKGALDDAIGNFGIGKKAIVKVRGKESHDGDRKTAIAAADASTAFLLRSALSDGVPTQVLNMIELTETVSN